MSKRWQLMPDALAHVRHWEGEYVLFFEPAADTHLLSATGMAVLQILQTSPATLEEVLNGLDERVGTLPAPEQINELLTQLSRLGLITSQQ